MLSEEELALWHKIQERSARTINSMYGTDPRHEQMGSIIADAVMQDEPIPWDLARKL